MAETEVNKTPPQTAADAERALILGARDKPGETKLPGSEQTVTEFRKEQAAAHRKEEGEQTKQTDATLRSESVGSDPLYTQQTTVTVTPQTLATLTLGDKGGGGTPGGGEANGGQGNANGGGANKGGVLPENDLPGTIPHKVELVAAGQTVYAELRAKSQNFIEGLPGIGREKAREIKAFIDADE